MPAEPRTLDRALHYSRNLKTARPQSVSSHSFSHINPHTHSHAHSHVHSRSVVTSHSHRPPKSTTPLSSPTMPYSVGQQHPPKLSPAHVPDVRSPSPNYFGLVIDQSSDPAESGPVRGSNWSPPTSSVKSFADALPQQLPLDANPEFEAFRRQADLNRGPSFGASTPGASATTNGSMLGMGGRTPGVTTPGVGSLRLRPLQPRRSGLQNQVSTPTPGPLPSRATPPSLVLTESQVDIDTEELQDSAYGSEESKRNSEEESVIPKNANPPAPALDMPQYQSPAQVESLLAMAQRSSLARLDERQARMSLDQARTKPLSVIQSSTSRADSLPARLESGGPTMLPANQLRSMMLGQMRESDLLLLDIRPSPQYSASRIKGALNLCLPTTLLKRATLEKLQETFQDDADQKRFSEWRCTKCLVVYDASASEKRDAQSAINMLKKFTKEGYTGATYILCGGFNTFGNAYPDMVDTRYRAQLAGGSMLSLKDRSAAPGPKVAPVIGGVVLPPTTNPTDPFFANIRQNIDLQDGVGQFEIGLPQGIDTKLLPTWLRTAADASDHGKDVSNKFLHIEKKEQSRMKNAYSNFSATCRQDGTPVQLCGIEKGGKNRYKDILPFEHARVKLQNKPDGACDYVNASHLKSTRSNKTYIASQGPLPATVEDFWSVIWDQDVRVIVMLTAESEGGQLKCHPYWRDKEFGSIKLRIISEKKVSLDLDKHRHNSAFHSQSNSSQETGRRRANTTTTLEGSTPTPQPMQSQSESPFVIVRKFALQNAANPFDPIREVTHLHYPSWPDFGTPAQPSHLLALVELANVMQRAASPVDSTAVVCSSSRGSPEPAPLIPGVDEPEPSTIARPMLVHCSAGCGRTGAFCTVDSVIDMLKRQRVYNLQASRKDAEGDVNMDLGDVASPMTTLNHPSGLLPSVTSAWSASKKPVHSDDDTKDMDLSWLGDESIDLIQKTVEDFRAQRLSMVQTLRQYVLCYETVLEWAWRAHDRGVRTVAGGDAGARGRARSGSLGATAILGGRAG